MKEKVEKEKKTRAPRLDTSVNFEDVEGLYMNAWDEWLAYRANMKFKKYKTTALARKIAKLPPFAQLACIEHSIANNYQGLFPDKFSNLKTHKDPYSVETLPICKGLAFTFAPYRTQNSDLWVITWERLPNGKFTNKQISFPITPENMEQIEALFSRVREANKRATERRRR